MYPEHKKTGHLNYTKKGSCTGVVKGPHYIRNQDMRQKDAKDKKGHLKL